MILGMNRTRGGYQPVLSFTLRQLLVIMRQEKGVHTEEGPGDSQEDSFRRILPSKQRFCRVLRYEDWSTLLYESISHVHHCQLCS